MATPDKRDDIVSMERNCDQCKFGENGTNEPINGKHCGICFMFNCFIKKEEL